MHGTLHGKSRPLTGLVRLLKSKVPPSIKDWLKANLQPRPEHGWFGDYSSWSEVRRLSTGYEAPAILAKVKAAALSVKSGEAASERDSVRFGEPTYSKPLVALLRRIAIADKELSVVDFGGSLGSTYFQCRPFLEDTAAVRWRIVEQPHFVDCGKECFGDDVLSFHHSIEDALAGAVPQVLLLSSVLQYLEKPYELIERCIGYGFTYIVVDRTAFIEANRERLTLQIVPKGIYEASYPCWYLNEPKFRAAFAARYRLSEDFDSGFDPPGRLAALRTHWKGFLFERKTAMDG